MLWALCFSFQVPLLLSSMVPLYHLNHVNDYIICYEHCSFYTSVNCVQYGGFTHKTTRVKFYTHNYTKGKILLSVSENLRVFSRVFFFTCVFRECISRVICVQNGRFTRKKHTCNAAIPVACTVAVKSLSETLTNTGHKGKQNWPTTSLLATCHIAYEAIRPSARPSARPPAEVIFRSRRRRCSLRELFLSVE